MSREDDLKPVGYKNPPQHTRYQKGQSGNPSGRRKAKPMPDMLEVIARVMSEPIQLIKNGKPRTVSYLEAIVRRTAESAVKGDASARRDLLKLSLGAAPSRDESSSELSPEEEAQLITRFLARERRSDGGCDR